MKELAIKVGDKVVVDAPGRLYFGVVTDVFAGYPGEAYFRATIEHSEHELPICVPLPMVETQAEFNRREDERLTNELRAIGCNV